MKGNGQGDYDITVHLQMATFDRLPLVIREALRNSLFDWATPPFLRMHAQEGVSPEFVARHIQISDRELAARERIRTWKLRDLPRARQAAR